MCVKIEHSKTNVLLTFDEVCVACGGFVLYNGAATDGVSSVAIDSRNCVAGSLFVPLRGAVQDGHLYCEAALKNGAVCFFVDEQFLAKNKSQLIALCKQYGAVCIVVKNTLYALQDCAAFYLKKFPKLIRIGITGSSGKTTTKEILAAILCEQYRTVFSKGNLNSETGLPLSVFTIREGDEVAIFELGMNRENEIAELAKVFQPQLAIITNIGLAHVGMLGSQEKIALEKKKIFSCFVSSCCGFIPQCEFTSLLQKNVLGKIFVVDGEKFLSEKFSPIKDLGENGFELFYNDKKLHFHLIGKHNLLNAAMAVAVAESLKLDDAKIRAGLEKVSALYGRAEIKKGKATYLFDVYNANPQSMSAALDFISTLAIAGKKVAVLGSMMELGDYSFDAHKKIIERVCTSDIAVCFLYGDDFVHTFEKIKCTDTKFSCFKTSEATELKEKLETTISKDDFVLLKGSRSLQLEQFVSCLEVHA